MVNPIALAVPFFFVLIAVELVWARAKGRKVYRFVDAIADLSCGIASQIQAVLLGAALLAAYALVYAHRMVSIGPVWVQWAVAFVAVDFVYYWWHRMSHEVNLLWAAHVVHHQSEDYNLAVALRQAVLTAFTILPFHFPLALVGVPPLVFATVYALSTLYQFWIHTQLVPRVGGPLGWVLNLPHHHRVHHAINPRYLDKNYAATLIVWDRLFGTFEEEVEPCVYGVTKPIRSFNPLWAQVEYFFQMGRMMRAASGLEKLRVVVASPAWKPEAMPAAPPREVSPETWEKYAVRPSRARGRYVLAQYILLVVVTGAVMNWHAAIPMVVLLALCASIALALASLSGILESKRWAPPLEIARLVASGAAVGLYFLR